MPTWKERARTRGPAEGRGNVIVDIDSETMWHEPVTVARFPWEKRAQAVALAKAILAEERPVSVNVYVRTKVRGKSIADWWSKKTLYTGSSW